MSGIKSFFSAILTTIAFEGAALANDGTDISQLAWLSGAWIGEGRGGDDGKVEGVARVYWTPPLDGVISNFFTWNKPAEGHVHHAISVFHANDGAVLGKGIHYGRDFKTFEDKPWNLRLISATGASVEFQCFENCSASNLTYKLIGGGRLEERWSHADESIPDWIVVYRRDEQ